MKVFLKFSSLIFLVFLGACSKDPEGSKLEAKSVGNTPTAMIQPKSAKPKKVSPERLKEKKVEQKVEIASALEDSGPVAVDMTSIAGRKVGGLYADMLGVKGAIPQHLQVDYGENLADMWFRKLDRKIVSQATIDNAHKPIGFFLNNPDKKSLNDFVLDAYTEIKLVREHLDWEGFCKREALEKVECAMLKKLSLQIRPIDLIAYGLTELMPSTEGKLNVKILDLLLRNAGANYVMTIPAMSDSLLSLGFYQFTSYALRHDEKIAGASIVNLFLPKDKRLSGSVITLRGSEHHRAAYMFAIYNFALLCKKTNAKEFATLRLASKQKPDDLVTFMATAHHSPVYAVVDAREWLASGMKRPLSDHLKKRGKINLPSYGKKTSANLSALEAVGLS